MHPLDQRRRSCRRGPLHPVPDKLGPVPGQGLAKQLTTQPPTASRELSSRGPWTSKFRIQGASGVLPCTASQGHPHSLKGRCRCSHRQGRDGQGPGCCHHPERFSGCWALHGFRTSLWIVSRREPHVGSATGQCQSGRMRPALLPSKGRPGGHGMGRGAQALGSCGPGFNLNSAPDCPKGTLDKSVLEPPRSPVSSSVKGEVISSRAVRKTG